MCLDSASRGESGEIKLRQKRPSREGRLLKIHMSEGVLLLSLQLVDGEDNGADQDDDGNGSDQDENLVNLVALLGERFVILGDSFGTLFEVI